MGPMAPMMDLDPITSHDAVREVAPGLTVPTSTEGIRQILSELDGHFIENLGQYGEGAGSYYCRGEPLSVAMGPGWVSYHHQEADGEEGVMVRIEFEGARPVRPLGSEPMSFPTNFIKGDDPDQWVVGARSYRTVTYEDLYDGIDLRYSLGDGMLKYDLLVEPFANISQVRFRYQGHDALAISEVTGDLVIRTPLVDLIDKGPVSFQEGPGGTGDIRSSYVLLDGSTVSFDVTGHDPSLPLVIDPGLTFSTFLGGDGGEWAEMLVDEVGDIYLAGWSESTDFPTTPGVVEKDAMTDQDGFICKVKADGSDLLFSTYIGSDGYDGCSDIVLDPSKNIIVIGYTNGTDFPTTAGAYQTALFGSFDDCFVMKLDPDCSEVIWSTLMGGSNIDVGFNIGLMSNGDLMLSGWTWSQDLPGVAGGLDTTLGGWNDMFATRMDPNGTKVINSTYLGGSSVEVGGDMVLKLGDDDEVYLSMRTSSLDFPTTTGAFSRQHTGGMDAAVIKVDGNLTQMMYGTYIGGTYDDFPATLTVDEAGCVYLVGSTLSDDFPTTLDAWDRSFNSPGYPDCFLTKVSDNGSSLEFSTYYGGEDDDYGTDIRLDDDGLVYFGVYTGSIRLPTTEHAYANVPIGNCDMYLAVLDGENQTIRYGTYLGGTGIEGEMTLVRLVNDSVVLSSSSTSIDYPTTNGAYDTVHNGDWDIVLTRFDPVLSNISFPGPPMNLTAVSQNLTVELDWDPPVDDGGLALSAYTVYRGTSIGAMTNLTDLRSAPTNYTDTLPEPGRTYYYSITASTPAGESDRSNIVNVTFITPPAPPTDLRAQAGCGTVQLSWTAPIYTGGHPLQGYRVFRGTNAIDMDLLASLDNVTSYPDVDVVNGQIYFYKVASFTKEGASPLSSVVSATPKGPPTAPLGLTATAGDGMVTLRWDRPRSDGGIPILGFEVFRGPDPDFLTSLEVVDEFDLVFVDDQVQNGVTYFYMVQAYNILGMGHRSPVIPATPLGLPSVPMDLEVSVAIGQVELTWKPPEVTGGSPINGFSVLRGPSQEELVQYRIVDDTTLTFIDTDPVYGRTSYYAVSARNVIGDGPRTPALNVWPLGLPEPPENVMLEVVKGAVSVSWDVTPQDGGSPVVWYVLHRGTSSGDLEPLVTVDGNVLSHQDTMVENGTTYYYAISTETAVGEGSLSEVVSGIPFTHPAAPRSLTFDRREGALDLMWAPPEDIGGRPIMTYRVYRGTTHRLMALLVETGDTVRYTDGSVVDDQAYYYAVAAVNEGGEGPWTDRALIAPYDPANPPGPPLFLRGRCDGVSVILTWMPPVFDGGDPVTGYAVFRGESPDDLLEVTRMEADLSYLDEGVEDGCRYTYVVSALNDAGMGELSKTVEVLVDRDVVDPLDGPSVQPALYVVIFLVILAAAVVLVESFRYSLLMLLLPLFSRFTRDKILDNKNRQTIHGFICDNPGIHFGGLCQEHELGQGVVAYHLDVLERESYVRSMRDGRLKRFYSIDAKAPNGRLRKTPEEVRSAILELVRQRPGISQYELVRELGLNRATVSYHLNVLMEEDKLKATKEGRRMVYHSIGQPRPHRSSGIGRDVKS